MKNIKMKHTLSILLVLVLLGTTAYTKNTPIVRNDTIEKVTHYRGGITVWRQTTDNYIKRSKQIFDYNTIKSNSETNYAVVKRLNLVLDANQKIYKASIDSCQKVIKDKDTEIVKKDKKLKNRKKVIIPLIALSIPTLIQLGELASRIFK